MTQPQPPVNPQNAYDYMVSLLKQWGLDSLAPDVLRLLQDGHTQDQVSLLLQDTDTYKKRFAGNEVRRKLGMAVLSPAEYLATEASYRQILQQNGMPPGFYDQPSDFADWIGKDVSPQEISSRVNAAVDATQRMDTGTQRAFFDYYNVTPNHLAAYFLDQDRALPLIQQQARAAHLGASAYNNKIAFDRSTAERLATSSLVNEQQYDQAIGSVAQMAPELARLGGIYGQPYSATDAANDVFFADADARRRRQRLTEQEAATFGGGSGVGRGSLAREPGQY